MKKYIIQILAIVFVTVGLIGCGNNKEANSGAHEGETHETHEEEGHDEDNHEEEGHAEEGHEEEGGMREVHLSDLKFNSLGMEIDTLPVRALSGVVEANGQLEVPPQHEATITAILGANVTSIKVIEGDKVSKGEVIAYLAHPNIAKLQTDYLKVYSQVQFLEKEFERQKRLFEEKVGSGQAFQQVQADYQAMKGEVKGYEAQLKLLGIDVENIREGEIYETIPVVSPIDGYIEKVLIQLGQYVDPQKEMFMVVNNEHIHADLMVFEKDVYKVKEGQKVYFTVQSAPGKTLSAKIFAVGRQFEQNPKAVHVHAEIEKKEGYLITGMYINGKIHTESNLLPALPEGAIVEEEGKSYIFMAEKHEEDGETEWAFQPVEIITGIEEDGWVEVKLLEPLPEDAMLALNNAYYLISEMKKSQTSHSH